MEIRIDEFGEVARVIPVSIQEVVNKEVAREEDDRKM